MNPAPAHRLASDALTLDFALEGGAIVRALTADGRPVLHGGFVMAPICNRMEGNSFIFDGQRYDLRPNTNDPLYLHGDGWQNSWQLIENDVDFARLAYEQQPLSATPYAYRVEQDIRLNGARIEFVLRVDNSGERAMPFGIGFHPYFPRTKKTTLHAPAQIWMSERDGHLPGDLEPIPADADFSAPRALPLRWLNNAFEGWTGRARIEWPENRLAVVIEADAPFSRYMLYSPGEGADFICFEPMSHRPNALATLETGLQGLRILRPGESLNGTMTITAVEQ